MRVRVSPSRPPLPTFIYERLVLPEVMPSDLYYLHREVDMYRMLIYQFEDALQSKETVS